MHAKYAIHGHAIVSDDDRIFDATGRTPDSLRNAADWSFFQAELDRAALVVCGRLGHLENPNVKQRKRLILSGAVTELENREDGWWWNPAQLPWLQVAQQVTPNGGVIAVTGGTRVFDTFLAIGFDLFYLVRKAGVRVPGGGPVFSACDHGQSAEQVLGQSGLVTGPTQVLDEAESVTLTPWQRANFKYQR